MSKSRGVVGTLGGFAALFAFSVGAVSLTRIAGDYLGFPPGLEWTLTGAVDVAGIAGGVMWTAFTGPVRNIGRLMNTSCSIVSGVGVGLDHATHAAAGWEIPAAIAGFLFPMLFSWILHALSTMVDQSDGREYAAGRGGHQHDTSTASARPAGAISASAPAELHQAASASTSGPHQDQAGGHQVTLVKLGTSTPAGARQALIATPPAPARATHAPRPTAPAARTGSGSRPSQPNPTAERTLRVAPAPRPEWMTDRLLAEIVAGMRRADSRGESYGRDRVMAKHNLNDPKAKAALRYIRDHRLLEAAS